MNLISLSLRYDGTTLSVIDQRLLPEKEIWVVVENIPHMVSLIQSLAVRGAPLIGVSAALALGHFSKLTPVKDRYENAKMLQNARPTAVNLQWAIERMLYENPDLNSEGLMSTAKSVFHEDVAMCQKIGDFGSDCIKEGEGILTICNTGGLATVGIGTALGAIRRAKEKGKNFHVYFCETRPLLQGARLTAWELERLEIPHTLVCDSMMGTLMAQRRIQCCLVGADRIARNGDFANKIGTYTMAVLAQYHQVPFFALAPTSTVDESCSDGRFIQIEERDSQEVRGVLGRFQWAPSKCKVYNPAFDVTPYQLVTGYILDIGVKKSCGESWVDLDLKSLTKSNI